MVLEFLVVLSTHGVWCSSVLMRLSLSEGMAGRALGLCRVKDGERWAAGGICSEKSDTFRSSSSSYYTCNRLKLGSITSDSWLKCSFICGVDAKWRSSWLTSSSHCSDRIFVSSKLRQLSLSSSVIRTTRSSSKFFFARMLWLNFCSAQKFLPLQLKRGDNSGEAENSEEKSLRMLIGAEVRSRASRLSYWTSFCKSPIISSLWSFYSSSS